MSTLSIVKGDHNSVAKLSGPGNPGFSGTCNASDVAREEGSIRPMSFASNVKSALPPSLKQVMRDIRGEARALTLRGRNVYCPVCNRHFRHFLSFNNRPNVRCPRCDSLERHRAAISVWSAQLGLFTEALRVLHVAPEWALARILRQLPNLDYVTGDLQPGRADLILDLTAIEAPDDSFDVVLCSHVLEHIPDDRRALAEIRRVLRSSGQAFLVVPYDRSRTEIYEDSSITDPEGRQAAFGQFDHVRWYSRQGFESRVRAAGFTIENLTHDCTPGLAWAPADLAVIARPTGP